MTVRFSASYMDRLMACPGSANLDLAIPGWEEPVRDDKAGAKGVGSSVHEVMQEFCHLPSTLLVKIPALLFEFQKMHVTKRREICENDARLEGWIIGNMPGSSLSVSPKLVTMVRECLAFTPKMIRYISDVANTLADILNTVTMDSTVWAERPLHVDWLRGTGIVT